MKLSISNIAWDNKNDETIYNLMNKYNYTGLEIAPTRIIPSNPYDNRELIKIWSNALKKTYNISIVSMQSIWYGRNENLFNSEEEYSALVEYTKRSIDFASALKCHNLVFGCPRNRNIPEGADANLAIEFFRTIGDYAYKSNSVIGIEANPSIYNTNFINNTLDAIELIKLVNSPGIKLNLDLGTMIYNNEDVSILNDSIALINHIHISEPYLKPIECRDIHRDLKKILVAEQYDDYISIEMSKIDNIEVINEKMLYVRGIYND